MRNITYKNIFEVRIMCFKRENIFPQNPFATFLSGREHINEYGD